MHAVNPTGDDRESGAEARAVRRGAVPLLFPVLLAVAVLSGAAARASAQCGADPGNDSLGTATPLGISCGITPAAIDCIGDVDFYAWAASTSTDYTIMTTGSTDTWMQLSDQVAIATDDNSGQDTNASMTANLTAGTKYFVAIKEASGTGTGAYVLGIAGSGTSTVYTYLVPATATAARWTSRFPWSTSRAR